MRITFLEEFDDDMEIDNYLKQHPTYSLEPLFGYLEYDDSRFQELFRQLKELGCNPRETTMQDRMMSIATITVDSDVNRLPQFVEDCINELKNVTLWDVTRHKGTRGYKIKFSLRDSNFVRS